MPDSKPSSNGASSFCTAVTCIDGRVQLPVIHYLTRRFHVEFVDIVLPWCTTPLRAESLP